MRLSSTFIPILVLLSACVARLPSDEEGGSEATGATEPQQSTSAGTLIVGETDDESTTVAAATGLTESESASDTVSSQSASASDTVATASASDTEPEETGQVEPPPACFEPADPAVAAGFALDLSAWALANDEQYAVDVACAVDAVDVVGGQVATAMTCDVEGAPLAAVLTIDAAPEGPVAWAAGDAVRLKAESTDLSELAMPPDRVVQLRVAADDALLVAAIDFGGDLAAPWYAPIVVDTTAVCGPEDGAGEPNPLMLDFSLLDAPEQAVTLFQGHRAALGVADEEVVFAIDVAQANTNNCCHFLRDYEVLIRRVNAG